MWLSPARARWLGYLYHAHAIGLPLSEYAQQQHLSLGELMDWERHLSELGIKVPPRHRPARFVAVEVHP